MARPEGKKARRRALGILLAIALLAVGFFKLGAIVTLLGVALLVLGFLTLGAFVERWINRVKGPGPPAVTDQALSLHRSGPVVDLHADSLLLGRNLLERSGVGHVDLPRMREGGAALQVFSTVTKMPLGANVDRTDGSRLDLISLIALAQRWPLSTLGSLRERSLYQARRLERFAQESNGKLILVRDRTDLERLLEARTRDPEVVGALLSIEGAHALEEDPESLNLLFQRGVRMIGLAHFFDNRFAGSAHGLSKGGLTPPGRDLVREMERRGIIIDLAHASAATIDDVLGMVKSPTVVSHTGVRATCPNNRNLTDDQVRAIAEGGGVIGIGFWGMAIGETSITAIVRAIRHVVDLVGDRHVALGSDFDGFTTTPLDASGLPAITQELHDEGFSEDSISRILGGNTIRVFRTVLPPGQSQ